MDHQVLGNNAERRVISRRPYRPRKQWSPRQPSQLDFIREYVSKMIKEQTEQEKKEEEEKKEVEKEEASKPPAKKTRRKYTMTFTQPTIDEEGNPIEKKELITARDLASLMPADQGVFVICNPEKSICKIKAKNDDGKKEIETIAKPRYNTPNNTLILTTKYTQPTDLDQILLEIQS